MPPRYVAFQLEHMVKPCLNVGVGGNPTGLEGPGIVHCDLDRWKYQNFVQADIHHLPVRTDSFASVICADVLEHVLDPVVVLAEARRVAPKTILTVFEEWRLGPPGRHVEEGQRLFAPCEEAVKPYRSAGTFLERYSESKQSHVPHIWAFTPAMIEKIIIASGMRILLHEEDCPGSHEGHAMRNLLYVLERAI